MFKKCIKCNTVYDNEFNEHFYFLKRNLDGIDTVCKYCRSTRKHKYKHIVNGDLICIKCKTYKDQNCFDISQDNWYRNFKDRRCKECKRLQYHYKLKESNKIKDHIHLLKKRINGIKARCIKKNMYFDENINIDFLINLYNNQNGLCAISGIKMTHYHNKGRCFTNLSIDRLDNTKGYLIDNIQLVCMAVNQMKSDLNEEELVYFCKNIIENHEKKNNNR